MPLPKMQAMRLTEAAAERVKALMASSEAPKAGLRVGIKKGGCGIHDGVRRRAGEIR
jgi:iron-sulfur cluster assembly protein